VIAGAPTLPVRIVVGGGPRDRGEQITGIGVGQGRHDLPARDDRPLAADLDLGPELTALGSEESIGDTNFQLPEPISDGIR